VKAETRFRRRNGNNRSLAFRILAPSTFAYHLMEKRTPLNAQEVRDDAKEIRKGNTLSCYLNNSPPFKYYIRQELQIHYPTSREAPPYEIRVPNCET
jgi:hypothetical protein